MTTAASPPGAERKWKIDSRHLEQGVRIAQLQANANIEQAKGQAEAIRLQASGEAEAIRATGQAKAEAYHVGVDALGAHAFTTLQLMQVIGERNVRVVPDVSVSGQSQGGLIEALLGLTLRSQAQGGDGQPLPRPKKA